MAKRKAATKMKIRKVLVRVTIGVNGLLKTYESVWGGSMSVGTMFQVGDEWARVQAVVNGTRGTQIVFAAMQGDPVANFGRQWKREVTNTRDTAAYINGLAALMMKKMEWHAIEEIKRCAEYAKMASQSCSDANYARNQMQMMLSKVDMFSDKGKRMLKIRIPAEMVESEDGC